MIDSPLSGAELLDILRRADAYGDLRRVPDSLRAEDVDTLTFSVVEDKGFRIVPNGLRNPVRRPRVSIEGCGEILPGRNGMPTRIQFEVGLDTSSIVGVVTTILSVGGLLVYNYVRDPTFGFSFWALIALGLGLSAVFYLQEQSLVERAWPGLLSEAKRVADGSLYVPERVD